MQMFTASAVLLVVLTAICAEAQGQPIRISRQYPRYWEYGGKPTLLLGGSVEDNLFQIRDLKAHLDLLKSVGGNYVRCTMSSRDPGDVWPFHQREDGKYDLERMNEEYWRRFESLLKLGRERGIIVQIEVWDRFDFAMDPWLQNPYNPANNINYSPEQSGLKTRYPDHPGGNANPFFRSVPELDNNALLLRYQRAQVDRMLSISLRYPNVLYCMDNETSGAEEWGAYWAQYIQEKAKQARVTVYCTEMWDPWDLSHPMHNRTFDHPERYAYADISQNNHQKGQAHWDNAQRVRARLSARPRPLNNVKIYGADTGRYGTDRDGIERFWRNIIGGLASARFHRPASGLGLSPTAQANIRSARMLTDAMSIFRCEPRNDLLSDREPNEAYLTAEEGRQYALFFPDGGAVTLDMSGAKGRFRLRWLSILDSRWLPPTPVTAGGTVKLEAPGKGYWAALLLPE